MSILTLTEGNMLKPKSWSTSKSCYQETCLHIRHPLQSTGKTEKKSNENGIYMVHPVHYSSIFRV